MSPNHQTVAEAREPALFGGLTFRRLTPWAVCVLSLSLPSALGQVVLQESHTFDSFPLPASVPDANASGVADSRVITSAIVSLTDVNVSFTLTNPSAAGAYNGDFYVTLAHESGFTVLLNRVGRRSEPVEEAALGYADNGFRVVFDDQASKGDVHTYRLQLSLTPGGPPANSHDTPVDPAFVQPLTGTWAPDGRNASPLTVTASDSRTALLGSFNGLPGAGRWTLFVADLNSSGAATLKDWGVVLSGVTVPEPEWGRGIVGAGLLALGAALRGRRLKRS